ncbi:MAG: glycosyltransferase [Burkholderiaceae bacterium]
MSVGAAIIGSDTEPVREVVRHRKTGLVTPFFDVDRLVTSIDELLEDERLRLGSEARKKVQSRFDLQTVCLPKWVKWAEGLASAAAPSRT